MHADFDELRQTSTDGISVAKASAVGVPLVTVAFDDPTDDKRKVLNLCVDPGTGKEQENKVETQLNGM